MSFDDHEENFVTLHNRNFTKIILEQLNRDRTSLEVGKEYDYEPTYKENDQFKQKTLSPSQNEKQYERLLFRVEEVKIETTSTPS